MKLLQLILMGACLISTACGSGTSYTSSDSSSLSLTTDQPRYFVSLYAYQGRGELNLPRRSHTWARFAAFDGADLNRSEFSEFAISWLAADGNIGMFQGIEVGRNFSHSETMVIAEDSPVNVQRTPYIEIDKTLYANAIQHRDTLMRGASTGKVKYKMIDDPIGRRQVLSGLPGGYSNCTHAVSDLVTGKNGALLNTGTKRGFEASSAVFDWFRKGTGVIDPVGINDWVVESRLRN